ncbi:peptidoglycan editing factor PgeF [Spirosoma luteolum]
MSDNQSGVFLADAASVLQPLFRTPALLAQFPTVVAAESTRHGGVSPAPYASLNLGINTDDQPAHVDTNRQRFMEALGAGSFGFVSSLQVHGTAVYEATAPGRHEGYDALITNRPGLLVGVTVADCVPMLIYDAGQRAVAAVHAGWRGTVGNIVGHTLARMQQTYGTRAVDCYVYVGTCIDTESFGVGPEVASQFDADLVQPHPETQQPCADLKRANVRFCQQWGVPAAQIAVSPYSTVLHNHDYFSYRAERGQTGRMLAVIGLRG